MSVSSPDEQPADVRGGVAQPDYLPYLKHTKHPTPRTSGGLEAEGTMWLLPLRRTRSDAGANRALADARKLVEVGVCGSAEDTRLSCRLAVNREDPRTGPSTASAHPGIGPGSREACPRTSLCRPWTRRGRVPLLMRGRLSAGGWRRRSRSFAHATPTPTTSAGPKDPIVSSMGMPPTCARGTSIIGRSRSCSRRPGGGPRARAPGRRGAR